MKSNNSSNIYKFTDQVAKQVVLNNKESQEEFLTGEKDLKLTRKQFEEKVLKLKNGKSYLQVLLIEGTILRAQKVIEVKIVNGEVIFCIPDWDNFISRVNAFHEVRGPY